MSGPAKDFFISFYRCRRRVGGVVADQLEAADYITVLQAVAAVAKLDSAS